MFRVQEFRVWVSVSTGLGFAGLESGSFGLRSVGP